MMKLMEGKVIDPKLEITYLVELLDNEFGRFLS